VIKRILIAAFLFMFVCAPVSASGVVNDNVINVFTVKEMCPILLYHHIVTGIPKDFTVETSAEKFEYDIRKIMENGYKPISIEEMYDYLQRDGTVPKKSVVITFDDGYLSNYEFAYPVLKKYNIKADMFINTDLVGADSQYGLEHFSWDQAREMEKSGLVTIYSHGYTHHSFTDISPEQLAWEYVTARDEINNELGTRNIEAVAYVGGAYSSATFELLKKLGAQLQLLVGFNNDTSIMNYNFFPRKTMYYTTNVVEYLDGFEGTGGNMPSKF